MAFYLNLFLFFDKFLVGSAVATKDGVIRFSPEAPAFDSFKDFVSSELKFYKGHAGKVSP